MKIRTRSRIFYIGKQRYKCEFEPDGFVFKCFIKKDVWHGWKKVYKNPFLTILHSDTFLTWSDETFNEHIDKTVQLFRDSQMKQISKSDAIVELENYYSQFPNHETPLEFFYDFFSEWKNDEIYEGYIGNGKLQLYRGSQFVTEIKYTFDAR